MLLTNSREKNRKKNDKEHREHCCRAQSYGIEKKEKNKIKATGPKGSWGKPANKDSDVGTIVSKFMSSNTTMAKGESGILFLIRKQGTIRHVIGHKRNVTTSRVALVIESISNLARAISQ